MAVARRAALSRNSALSAENSSIRRLRTARQVGRPAPMNVFNDDCARHTVHGVVRVRCMQRQHHEAA